MTIQIEDQHEKFPDSDYRFRIVNTRTGYEEKSYSLKEERK